MKTAYFSDNKIPHEYLSFLSLSFHQIAQTCHQAGNSVTMHGSEAGIPQSGKRMFCGRSDERIVGYPASSTSISS